MQRHRHVTLWHIPGLPLLWEGYTLGKEKGEVQDSDGHRRWVMKGNLGWTFSNRQWMVVEEWLVW